MNALEVPTHSLHLRSLHRPKRCRTSRDSHVAKLKNGTAIWWNSRCSLRMHDFSGILEVLLQFMHFFVNFLHDFIWFVMISYDFSHDLDMISYDFIIIAVFKMINMWWLPTATEATPVAQFDSDLAGSWRVRTFLQLACGEPPRRHDLHPSWFLFFTTRDDLTWWWWWWSWWWWW